jgi:ABC-type amino acid transport substrate-binding protein
MIKGWIPAILFLFIFPVFSDAASMQKTDETIITITMQTSQSSKFKKFTEGRDYRDINDFASPLVDSTGILDTMLIIKSLIAGGINPKIEIIESPNSARSRELVKSGIALVSGNAEWDIYKNEYEKSCYFTDVVIPNGVFEKGFYTTKEKSATLQIHSVKDLRNYSATCNMNWVIDWATLKKVHVKALYDAPSITAMFTMVAAGRADFTLQNFSSNSDLSIEDSGVRLYPVRGVKLTLNGTRLFMVNKNAPDGKKVFDALNKGLSILKQNGFIMRALREAGIYNMSVKDWKLLQVE